jgi:hypothetical protein
MVDIGILVTDWPILIQADPVVSEKLTNDGQMTSNGKSSHDPFVL